MAVIAIVVAVAFYAIHDPAADGMAPRCLFRTLTGWDCPGCGFQRALHAALHGDIASAWHYNPFVFFALPLALLYGLVEYMPGRFRSLRRLLLNPFALAAVAASIAAWWILRNVV